MEENAIKDILLKHKMTHKALSEATGISLRAIDEWSRGSHTPPEWLPKMIDAYLISIGK